ncbi:MAG TPA: glyoxalase [Micromonosporaceae bacterium]|nr:glyoxalase [Micromonosporaceae bacterium]
MALRFQLTIDCADPDKQARFWAEALRYQLAPPPDGFESWQAFYRSIGVPESELAEMGDDVDRIVDSDGVGPRIWFQVVPEGKTVKNRLHLDIHASAGRGVSIETRREQVDAEVARLVALGAKVNRVSAEPGLHHYAVTLYDPEGNEFCVN